MTDVKVCIRSVAVQGLDAPDPVFLYIYTVDEIGNPRKLLGESYPVIHSADDDIHEFTCHDLETSETELAFVFAAESRGLIASATVQIDTRLFQSTFSAKLETLAPTFSAPFMVVDVCCIPLLVIRYIPGLIVVGDLRDSGCVCPPLELGEYELELRIVDRKRKTVAVVKSNTVSLAEQFLHCLALVNCGQLELEVFLSLGDLESLTADISVIERFGERRVKLIDTIPLKRIGIGEAMLVGSLGEGQILCCRKNETLVPINIPRALELRSPGVFESVQKTQFTIHLAAIRESIFGGQLEITVVGEGFSPLVRPGSTLVVKIEGPRLETSISVLDGKEVPMAALVVRDASGNLSGLYSIPLMESELMFPSDGLHVKIQVARDENFPTIRIPTIETPDRISVDEFATTSLQVLIEKATGLDTKAASALVAVRIVQLSVPPVLLKSSEVLMLQADENLEPRNAGITVTREHTANPIWQQTLELDVTRWVSSDWLYFMLYDNGPKGSVLLGHTCLPLGLIRVDGKSFHIPLVYPDSSPSKATLTVSFPKLPVAWSPIYLQQHEGHLLQSEGELKLTVEIFHSKDDEAPLKRTHMWLPINPLLPVILDNCPPTGLVRLALSRLNGTVMAEAIHRFSSRNLVRCGRFEFIITRSPT